MKRVSKIKYALMAVVMLTFTAMLTSCGSDDNNDNVITPDNPTPSSKTLTTLKVRYQAEPVDLASLVNVTENGGPIYMRYVDADGSIKQEAVSLSSAFNIDRSVEYTVSDSTMFGMQMIGVPDIELISGILSPLNLHITITATVERVYSDNSSTTVVIKRDAGLILGMSINYAGFSNSVNETGGSIVNLIENQTRNFGGILFNCFSGLAGKSDSYSHFSTSANANRFWASHKFTVE